MVATCFHCFLVLSKIYEDMDMKSIREYNLEAIIIFYSTILTLRVALIE